MIAWMLGGLVADLVGSRMPTHTGGSIVAGSAAVVVRGHHVIPEVRSSRHRWQRRSLARIPAESRLSSRLNRPGAIAS